MLLREIKEGVLLQLGNFREREVDKVLEVRATDYLKKRERKHTRNQRV